MRISGLATGIDTDQVIKDLLKANRASIDKIKQDRKVVEWQRDALRELNAKALEFRNSKVNVVQQQMTATAKTIAVTGNPTAVTARTTAGAMTGTIELEVTQRATAATNRSAADIRLSPAFDPAKPLADEMAAGNVTAIDLANNATMTINGTAVTIESGNSLNDIIEKINKNTNVTALYDTFTGQLSLVSKQTGRTNGIGGNGDAITLTGGLLENTLRITQGSAQQTTASNAQLKLNKIATERTSNTFTVNGVEVSLQQTNVGQPTFLEIKSDVATSIATIKKFVTDYNDMLTHLQSKFGETRYKDYPPLTDEQRKALSETEIEQWEKKAKSGLLRNDTILEQTMTQLRQAISSTVQVGGVSQTLHAIGITTGNYKERGKLYVSNETKLRTAIENNPDLVQQLFNQTTTPNAEGVLVKIERTMEGMIKKIADRAGTSTVMDSATFKADAMLGRQLSDMDSRIKQVTKRTSDTESRYYKQFTALESAIQRFNAQSSYLANQLSKG